MEKQSELWILTTDKGLVYTDKKGGIWLGGSPSLVYIPIFRCRRDAILFRERVRRHFKNSVVRTQYCPNRFYTERVKIEVK